MRSESGFRIAQNWPKSEKWQWRHNFLTWRHCDFFLLLFVYLVNFSYWSTFCVKIIAGSGVMTIFFCKGLTRNPEIGNTTVWVLPNIWRLVQVRNTKFGTNVSNEMLLNAAKCQRCGFYRFWVIKRKPTKGVGEGVRLPLNFYSK